MKKILLFLCFALVIISSGLFAQQEPKKMLSQTDINAVLKNYNEIVKSLDEIDYTSNSEYLEFLSKPDAGITTIQTMKVPKSWDAAVSKHGVTTPDPFVKYMVILIGTATLFLEEMFISQEEMYKAYGMDVSEQKLEMQKTIVLFNSADIALLRKNYAALKSILE